MSASVPAPQLSERPLSKRDDQDLMRAYQQGDPKAFAELVRRHEKPVFRFCLRALGGQREAAADATQEVFLRVVKNADRWEEKAKFTTWLYTIAKNFCIDDSRKARFRRTDSLNETVGKDDTAGTEKIDMVKTDDPGPDRLGDSKRIRAVVDEAVAALPPEQREVFCLREFSGLSFKDIAAATETGENTVKSRMRYALVALKDALRSAGFHPPSEEADAS